MSFGYQILMLVILPGNLELGATMTDTSGKRTRIFVLFLLSDSYYFGQCIWIPESSIQVTKKMSMSRGVVINKFFSVARYLRQTSLFFRVAGVAMKYALIRPKQKADKIRLQARCASQGTKAFPAQSLQLP